MTRPRNIKSPSLEVSIMLPSSLDTQFGQVRVQVVPFGTVSSSTIILSPKPQEAERPSEEEPYFRVIPETTACIPMSTMAGEFIPLTA